MENLDLSKLFGPCSVLETAGPPRNLYLLFQIYGHDTPNDDPDYLDIILLREHEFTCDTAALVETGAGFIWLSLRDLKATWPNAYNRFRIWHKRETGQSPVAFMNQSASNSPSAPAEEDLDSCAEAASGRNGGLAGVHFHPQTLAQFTCAISQGNYSLVQQDFQFFGAIEAGPLLLWRKISPTAYICF